eukprot:gnl/MRDRNA2_/MRDRNA2_89994_c0_seq1.p1 gnl/MRDRNA2_/MRDRNA2_89994_c0~~gnl/MRDRNA2_/MRDRNA2_89994_c0_seq1.p1  ORF type:complete len:577 (-),score=156.73 gnl/MRDRNA2_/MRDRNA2_89994_c0_seq1:156-1886(-)
MQDDAQNLRRVADHNSKVVDGVSTMSRKLASVDPKKYEETSATAKRWTQNVHELKASLEQQQGISKAMRESVRIEEEEQGQSFRDKYNFLIERLKSDIRFFFHHLENHVDLPTDFTREKTWDHYIHLMETQMKKLPVAASDGAITNLDPVISLLNFRENVMSVLLNGILFQKAVLDWDLKTGREHADKCMVLMFDHVVNLFSKAGAVPAKLVVEVPELTQEGPFTFKRIAKKDREVGSIDRDEKSKATELPIFPGRLLTVLREFNSLDSGLRNAKFGQEVIIPDKVGGKTVAAEELRHEVTKWFQKCQEFEHELQVSKASRHAPLHQQVESLTGQLQSREETISRLMREKGNLESDVTRLSNERQELVSKLKEMNDRYTRMASANVPRLDRLEELLRQSSEAVDVLTADAELLSSMFRTQVQENKKNIEDRAAIAKDLKKLQGLLKQERQKNTFMNDELKKKETLIVRAIAARKSMHESFLAEREKSGEIEESMKQRDRDWQEMLSVISGRDAEIEHLHEDLRRANHRVDELEQQKAFMMKKFVQKTGQASDVLLESQKTVLTTMPESTHDKNAEG